MPENLSPSPLRINRLPLLALLLVPVALYFTGLCQYPLRRAAEAIRFPYQLDAEEGFLLGQALRLAGGKGLYPPIQTPPYVVDNYPPLYAALWGIAAQWAGPSLAPGRWITLFGSMLTAISIAMAVFGAAIPAQRKSKWPSLLPPLALAWLCPLLFLTSAAHLRWMAYARVDLLATGLSLAGIACMALWGRQNRWARVAAILLFGLAFLTKQTAILAPAASILWLLLLHRRIPWRYLAGLAAAFLIPALILVALTSGRYWFHLVTYNENTMNWSELGGWAWQQRALYAPLLLAIVLLAPWAIGQGMRCLRSRRGTAENQSQTTKGMLPPSPFFPCLPDSLWLALLYLSLNALSLLTLAKAGAAENYLLEPTAAASLFLGIALSALLAPMPPNPLGSTGRPIGIPSFRPLFASLILALLLWHAVRFHARQIEPALFFSAPRPNLAALLQGNRVIREIRSRPGPILAEDPIYILKAGHPILFQNFIMTQLAAEKKWDPSPIVRLAQRRRIALIAAHQDLFDENQFFNRYPPALRQAIRANYTLLKKLERPPLQPIFLYIPQLPAVQ